MILAHKECYENSGWSKPCKDSIYGPWNTFNNGYKLVQFYKKDESYQMHIDINWWNR